MEAEGYNHSTANHQQHYMDPDILGAHTQAVERSWFDSKISVMKKELGIFLYLLQSHLDHYCRQMWREDERGQFLALSANIRITRTHLLTKISDSISGTKA